MFGPRIYLNLNHLNSTRFTTIRFTTKYSRAWPRRKTIREWRWATASVTWTAVMCLAPSLNYTPAFALEPSDCDSFSPVHCGHRGHSKHEPTRCAMVARISIITQWSRASELREVRPRVCSSLSMLWTNAPLHSYVTPRCHGNPNITRLFGCALHATPLPVLWRYLVSGKYTNKIYRWLPLSWAHHYMQLRVCPVTPRHKPSGVTRGVGGVQTPPPEIPKFCQSWTGLQIERKMFSVPIPPY